MNYCSLGVDKGVHLTPVFKSVMLHCLSFGIENGSLAASQSCQSVTELGWFWYFEKVGISNTFGRPLKLRWRLWGALLTYHGTLRFATSPTQWSLKPRHFSAFISRKNIGIFFKVSLEFVFDQIVECSVILVVAQQQMPTKLVIILTDKWGILKGVSALRSNPELSPRNHPWWHARLEMRSPRNFRACMKCYNHDNVQRNYECRLITESSPISTDIPIAGDNLNYS